MKAIVILKSIALGLFSELGVSLLTYGSTAIGGWGPCGPGNIWGMAGMLIQYPGFYLEEEVLRWGKQPGVPGDLLIIFSIQAFLWSLAWMVLMRYRAKLKINTEPSTAPNDGPAKPLDNSSGREEPSSVS